MREDRIESGLRVRAARTWAMVLVTCVVTALSVVPSTSRAADSPFAAPKGKAAVVFVRDRFIDRKWKYVIFQDNRDCVAILEDRGSEVAEMKPGDYTLYVLGANVNRMRLQVQAGRTYFVRVNSKTRYAKGVAEITMVKRGSPEAEDLKLWVAEGGVTKGEDACKGIKVEDDKRGRTSTRIGRADTEWEEGGKEFQDKYTLRKNDGFGPKELAKFKPGE